MYIFLGVVHGAAQGLAGLSLGRNGQTLVLKLNVLALVSGDLGSSRGS